MEIVDDSVWQMSRGGRAALEGVLSERRPRLAVAIGTGTGTDPEGSLARIAHWAEEVHAFEFARPEHPEAAGAEVILHVGDPQELLPVVLSELAAAERNVDLVLLDGRAAPDGVRANVEDLLESSALARTVILVHHTADERVRRGFDAVHFGAWPKVVLVEPDFVPGHILAGEPGRHQLWGGLALAVLDATHRRYATGPVMHERYCPSTALLAEARGRVIAREQPGQLGAVAPAGAEPGPVIEHLRRELAEAEHEVQRLRRVARHHEELWHALMDSWSWRLTGPLRAAKELVRGGGA